MANKILNQSQAIAVRDAMCALNNVSARLAVTFGDIEVVELANGTVRIVHNMLSVETHAGQNAFFAAYGIE